MAKLLSLLCVLVLLMLLPLPPAVGGDAKQEKMVHLGTVVVGKYKGLVLFQYPEDDGKNYRVDVAVSKPNNTPPIDSSRIEVWLLARGGKAIALKERPRPGSLGEVGSMGTTACAIYFFPREAERKDLVGVVVSVDGELTTLKLPPPAK